MNKYTVRALKSNIIKLKVRLNGIKLEVRKEIIIFFRIGGVILVETGHKLLVRIQVLVHAHGCFSMGKLPSIRGKNIQHTILSTTLAPLKYLYSIEDQGSQSKSKSRKSLF